MTRRHFETDSREVEAPAEPCLPVDSARSEPRPPGSETASRQTSAKWKYAIVAFVAMCLALACVTIVLLRSGDSDKKRSSPFQVSGSWSVTDLRGTPMGTITLSPDGQFDDGEYIGQWSLRDGCIHVRAWEGEPNSLMGHLFPQVGEVVLVPQFDPENDAWTLRNENVTMTRATDGE